MRNFREPVIRVQQSWNLEPMEHGFYRTSDYYKVLEKIAEFVAKKGVLNYKPPTPFPLIITTQEAHITRSPIYEIYKLIDTDGEPVLGVLTDSYRLIILPGFGGFPEQWE